MWWPACTFPLWITISALILKLIPTGFSWAYPYVSLHRRGKRPQVAPNLFLWLQQLFSTKITQNYKVSCFEVRNTQWLECSPNSTFFFSFEKQINTLLQEKKKKSWKSCHIQYFASLCNQLHSAGIENQSNSISFEAAEDLVGTSEILFLQPPELLLTKDLTALALALVKIR